MQLAVKKIGCWHSSSQTGTVNGGRLLPAHRRSLLSLKLRVSGNYGIVGMASVGRTESLHHP